MPGDFDYTILDTIAHRRWPMPDRPWIMTQTWHDLLFAHWRVNVAELRAMVPPVFALDLYDDEAWIGIVPFHMTNVAPRGIAAMPWVSAFPELNVRTYVRHENKPGVYFFSLDAGNPLVVVAARALFHLPYYSAEMSVEIEDGRVVRYRSRRTPSDTAAAQLRARYLPVGPPHLAESGTLEYFLTERYCLFTLDRARHPSIVDIHHRPWSLHAAEAEFECNTMMQASGLHVAETTPLLHFSKRQDVVAWPLKSLPRGI